MDSGQKYGLLLQKVGIHPIPLPQEKDIEYRIFIVKALLLLEAMRAPATLRRNPQGSLSFQNGQENGSTKSWKGIETKLT